MSAKFVSAAASSARISRIMPQTKRSSQFLGVQRNLENTFFVKLRPAIASVVKERALLFLFNEDSGLLAWADPAVDITAEIAKRVDQP
jgi:hypothetical protein